MEQDETPPAHRASVDTSNRQRSGFGWGAALAFASAVGFGVVAHWLAAVGGFVGIAFVIGMFLLLMRARVLPRFGSPGSVSVNPRARALTVEIPGRATETLPLSRLRAAHIDESDAVLLEIDDGRRLRLPAKDVVSAAKLVEELGWRPTRVRRIPLLSVADVGPAMGRIVGGLGLVVSFVVGTAGLFSTVASVLRGFTHRGDVTATVVSFTVMVITYAVATALAAFFRKGEAVVGADGVFVRSLVTNRFIPYSRVRNVVTEAGGIRLELDKGPSVELPLSFLSYFESERSSKRPPAAEVVAVAMQIRRAIERTGKSDASNTLLRELDRGERTGEAWRQAVASLAERDQGYRGAAVDVDDLVRVAEDAAAPPERRVGAALAIQAGGDANQKRRVRIAAAECADVDMKAALEQAAEGEILEAELERASLKQKLG